MEAFFLLTLSIVTFVTISILYIILDVLSFFFDWAKGVINAIEEAVGYCLHL